MNMKTMDQQLTEQRSQLLYERECTERELREELEYEWRLRKLTLQNELEMQFEVRLNEALRTQQESMQRNYLLEKEKLARHIKDHYEA